MDVTQFGERIMIIYMDIFGNELREVKTSSDFGVKTNRKRKNRTTDSMIKRAPNKPRKSKSKKIANKTAGKSKRKTAKKSAQRRNKR